MPDTTGHELPPTRRRRRPSWLVLAWLALLILAGGSLIAATTSRGSDPHSTGARSAASSLRDVRPVIPATSAAPARLIVSLTFDDGNADQMVAARELRQYRMRGTFFVPSGWVGLPHYLSLSDLRDMAAAGMEIGGHTVLHTALATVSTAEATREVCDDRANLLAWGFHVTSFAYPYDVVGPREEKIVKSCGYNSGRALGSLRSPMDCAHCPRVETIPPANPYRTRSPTEVDYTWTLAKLKDAVTGAEGHGKGWLQLTFHHICDGCNQLSVTPRLLRQFLAWLAPRAARGTVVRTVDQVIGGRLRPPRRAPAAHAVPDGTNAVHNSSLETAGHDGFPKCWQGGNYGVNTVHFSRTHDAHSGHYAERVKMTARTSGDAKLLPTLDLGECAPTVRPGHRYTLKVWYTSTAMVTVSTFYRNARGAWVTWTDGPTRPANRDWTSVQWQTPKIPAGATGFSFGLRLTTTGTLTTDDYSLVG